MIKIRESDILNQIIKYLHYRPGKYWRQNTGAFTIKEPGRKPRFVRAGVKGAADITGIRDGRRIEIEVKRPGNKPTEDQLAYGEMIKDYGGLYLVAYSVDDVRNAGL